MSRSAVMIHGLSDFVERGIGFVDWEVDRLHSLRHLEARKPLGNECAQSDLLPQRCRICNSDPLIAIVVEIRAHHFVRFQRFDADSLHRASTTVANVSLVFHQLDSQRFAGII